MERVCFVPFILLRATVNLKLVTWISNSMEHSPLEADSRSAKKTLFPFTEPDDCAQQRPPLVAILSQTSRAHTHTLFISFGLIPPRKVPSLRVFQIKSRAHSHPNQECPFSSSDTCWALQNKNNLITQFFPVSSYFLSLGSKQSIQ